MGEQLFKGTEAEPFAIGRMTHGARYYVYAMGEFARESPELQMRYFVNALNPDGPTRYRRGCLNFGPSGFALFPAPVGQP